MDITRTLIPGDIYRHFKNRLYQIITIAYDSETDEKYVVYQALYGDFKTYIRSYDMFTGEVDHIKYPQVTQKYRFEKVNIEQTEHNVQPDINNDATEDVTDDGEVNEYLMGFLDKESCSEKIEYLNSIRDKIDDRLISDIAVSMDITLDETDLDSRISSMLNCLKTKARYECNRFR